MEGREILIGVTGGIAAYKSAILVSRLTQAGAGVSVVMTESAQELITPRTFQALTGRPVRVKMFEAPEPFPHLTPARKADIFCIVPATANILGKAACGIADDLVSTLILAFSGPILFAPAMNTEMWGKPAVQRNVRQLIQDGCIFVPPQEGHLACGETGTGRMADPEKIFEKISKILSEISD
ncbi:MAG: flavoprotein [Planctomycetia bacterium]|nr:flavoprotein [Planctomycetia bacterium]